MKNFEKPCQVRFVDFENEIHYGIAYHNEIICACCGSIFEIDEVEILQQLSWANFEREISQ